MTLFPSFRIGVKDVRHRARPWHFLWQARWPVAVAFLAVFLVPHSAPAQDDEKPKLPGIDKIISANEHLMFTGTVKNLDEKHNFLSVSSVEGEDTEIFPIKHSTHVETADGFRKKLAILSPGTRIMVYYDQRADHRTVTNIQLFTSESKKKEPHS